MHRYPVSPTGVLLLGFFGLFKVSKTTSFNYDLFKVSKMTLFNYDLFKVRKMVIFNYDLFKVSDSSVKLSDPGNFLKSRFIIFRCQKYVKKGTWK